MGLFNFFKNKKQQPAAAASEEKPAADSFENFHSFYLYGFTNNPWRQSTDIKAWGELYQRVIGIRGGITTRRIFSSLSAYKRQRRNSMADQLPAVIYKRKTR